MPWHRSCAMPWHRLDSHSLGKSPPAYSRDTDEARENSILPSTFRRDLGFRASRVERHFGYCFTNFNAKAVFCAQPIAGKCQPRTSFSMHFATDGSSPVAETPCALPSGPTVSETLTLTVGFVVGLRSQHARRIPTWWSPMTCCI